MAIEVVNIVDLFKSIVANLKQSANILSITDLGNGFYTVVVDDNISYFSKGLYFTISGTVNFDGQYLIYNVDTDSNRITISKTKGLATETGVATTNYPYFEAGHLTEIKATLQEKDESNLYKYQKYPLIILLLDINEGKGSNANNSSISVDVLILNSTDSNYKALDRNDNNFKPILEPLYARFIQELKGCGYFVGIRKPEQIEHAKTNRYYWGSQAEYGNTSNILGDHLDGIEITNLALEAKYSVINCTN